MAYLARTLITRSWFLSTIVARNLQTVRGDQLADGLILLNSLLDFKQVETPLIPYWTYIELPAVPSQEFYFLPNVADVESVTFNVSNVRYPMNSTHRRSYYGSSRVDNISTLPFNYNFNRSLKGGNLGLYFKPLDNYPLKLMVKLFLVDVTLDTDLTNIASTLPYTFPTGANAGYDTSYIEYLRFALAEYMCAEYGIIFNPQSQKILNAMRRTLAYVSPPDTTMQKTSILTQGVGINWGDVNIGMGWRPS